MSKERSSKKNLTRILDNIKRSMQENEDNIKRFNSAREFTFSAELSPEVENSVKSLNKPPIRANVSEAFLSRFRGDFVKNEPGFILSIKDGAKIDEKTEKLREVNESHLRRVFENSSRNGVLNSIVDEIATGGFSVVKIYTDYEEGDTFRKKIVWNKVYNSTFTGFDVLARHPSKSDGNYCFETFPYPKERFEELFDKKMDKILFSEVGAGFQWFYRINDLEVVVVADYYEKEFFTKKLVKLSNGEIIEKSQYKEFIEQWDITGIANPPVIVEERDKRDYKIIRYQLCGNSMLKIEEMDEYKYLPLVFFDGNSIVLSKGGSKTSIMTRPYLINTFDCQKVIDQLIISLADECQRLGRTKAFIAEESISDVPEYRDSMTKPQFAENMIYQSYNKNDPTKPNPPPMPVPRNAFPGEVLSLFQYVTGPLMQMILGTYDSALGINNNQLSGSAILQGAVHSGASSEPYMNNYIISLNTVFKIILSLIPKVYVDEMSIGILNMDGKREEVNVNGENELNLMESDDKFNIEVKAGIGFAAQQTQAIAQIVQLSQSMPIFAEFINTIGLDVLVNNLNVKGSDVLKERVIDFMEELKQKQQMQQQQPNPLMIKAQNDMKMIELKDKQNDVQNTIDAAKLALQQEELELKKVELEVKASAEEQYIDLKREEIDADHARSVVEHAHKQADQYHKHSKDIIDTHHQHKMDMLNLQKEPSQHHVTGNPHLTE